MILESRLQWLAIDNGHQFRTCRINGNDLARIVGKRLLVLLSKSFSTLCSARSVLQRAFSTSRIQFRNAMHSPIRIEM